ncbi:hypothetical protein VPNG_03771 [Cytospora leucostoma]|uniref:REJ domain-containing protein n=1 Tax=Cytospora leucostoma TaxID=1230097 RepID=A0A423XF54_9PEZI|nr:hypothetical protein VPNG_03771 [Cytospora leucostoma]
MTLRRFLLALAGSLTMAQPETMSGMDMSTTNGAAASTAATRTQADMTSTITSLPSAIMPPDVSASLSGSSPPSTLVLDTMRPPSPSSSKTWAVATPGVVSGGTTSGKAMSTSSSPTTASSTGATKINGMGSVYSKISMDLLALGVVVSAVMQL